MSESEKLILDVLEHVMRGIDQVRADQTQGARMEDMESFLEWQEKTRKLISKIAAAKNQH